MNFNVINAIVFMVPALIVSFSVLWLVRRIRARRQAAKSATAATSGSALPGATAETASALSSAASRATGPASASSVVTIDAGSLRAVPAPTDVLISDVSPATLKFAARTANSTSGQAINTGFEQRTFRSKNEPTRALPVIPAGQIPTMSTDDYVLGPATPVLAAFLPESEARQAEVQRELQNAGYYEPHALQNFSAVRYVLLMGPILFLGALLVLVPPQAEPFVIAGLVVAPLLGWAVPRLFLKQKAAERVSEIEKAMPDMLDMLNMCVSQGMTVQSSLKRVSQELVSVHPSLHRELQIVTEQAQIGTLQQALANFSARVNVPEVHSFTSLLIQTERMGTSVSGALAEYSDNIRESIKQKADEKGNQAAFKLLFPTVTCLMPAVYLFLLGPAVIELSNFFRRDDQTLEQANRVIQQTNQPAIRPPQQP